MKHFLLIVALFSLSVVAVCAPLGTAARTVIPGEVQQIISVDYRSLKTSPTALELKNRVLPENLKQFEAALRSFGIDPDRDVETLTFAAFRMRGAVRNVGIAQGQFPLDKVLKRLKLKKITGVSYRKTPVYPMAGSLHVVFLDAYTMLFGDQTAVRNALDTRDGETASLQSNAQLSDLMADSGDSAVWSVLDAQGTQYMLRSAMGDAARLADYDVVKKRLLGSRYVMDFTNGVAFDLDVVTSDNFTAATLSALVKASLLYRKMTANGVEKAVLENVTVDSDSDRLKIHFRADDKRFQAFLATDLFSAVSR